MTRTCTVCRHPEREAIDKALVGEHAPYRTIANQYGLTHNALLRHKADHLLDGIVAAWQAERAQNGRELGERLEGWMQRITMLLDACHEWLLDPHDRSRYDLAPRAHEVWCHFETGRGEGRTIRQKARLSELLARLETAGLREPYSFTMIEQKSADPRKLIIDAAKQLESSLRLVAEIEGKIQVQAATNYLATEEWIELRTRMLDALLPYPDARLALAVAMRHADG